MRTPRIRQRLSAILATLLVALLVATGASPVFAVEDQRSSSAVTVSETPVPEEGQETPQETQDADVEPAGAATPSGAEQSDLGLSVAVQGNVPVRAWADTYTAAQLISLPSGQELAAGAVTTMTLDRTLKYTAHGTLPAGATSQAWDHATNTLTVTWGPLTAGNVYSASVNAQPSGVATQGSSFQATVTFTGELAGGDGPVTQTSTSAPLPVATDGQIPASFTPVEQGSWAFDNSFRVIAPPGVRSQSNGFVRQKSRGSSFADMQLIVEWGAPVEDAEPLPKSWIKVPQLGEQGFDLSRRWIRNDDTVSQSAYGAVGGATTYGWIGLTVTPPADAVPGTYALPMSVIDVAPETGDRVVVDTTLIQIIVPQPEAVELSYAAGYGGASTKPGATYEWGQRLSAAPFSGAITDLTVTMPVPEHTRPTGLFAQFIGDGAPIRAKAYYYTTDAEVSEKSTWQKLSLTGNTIDPKLQDAITGLRYVLKPMEGKVHADQYGAGVTFEISPQAPEGSTIKFETQSVTYTDPVAGPTSLEISKEFNKSVTVEDGAANGPSVAVADRPSRNGDFSFEREYLNGQSFKSRFFLGSDGVTALQDAYQFLVIPAGMSATQTVDACSPHAWPYQNGGCGLGTPVFSPTPKYVSGQVGLKDGSTLLYAQMPEGELHRAGKTNLQQLHQLVNFNLKTMTSGTQTVLVGMGSATQDELTQSTDHASGKMYSKRSLSEASSYGVYSQQSEEIRSKLSALGITADTAFMAERTFLVSPEVSVGSETTIQGSEDETGIVQGEGTATTRPGGKTMYSIDVTNTGSQRYSNFEFIDVLPHAGDKYTLNSSKERGSEFDVNLSGNVAVLLNGKATNNAKIEYSTSSTPARFDASGADVQGDPWLPFTGAAPGGKALRVSLGNRVQFNPGDKLTLSFDATVPASAPRDGQKAQNTIAYRFAVGEETFASETPRVAVQSSAPAGDTELSGHVFLDTDGDGVESDGDLPFNAQGVSLQLYKMDGKGEAVAVGAPVVPNTDNGVEGSFAFIGLEVNQTYRVKPVTDNPNVEVPAEALDSEGYLIYRSVSDEAANAPEDTSGFVGKSKFRIGDEAGLVRWVKDLRLPVTAATDVSGKVVLADTKGHAIMAGKDSPAGEFVEGFAVSLRDGDAEIASTKTNVSGQFEFTGIEGLAPGDYSLVFTRPEGSLLVASPFNNEQVFDHDTYTITALQPGTGASNVQVQYTDTLEPELTSVSLNGGQDVDSTLYNPTAFTPAAKDRGTRVVKYAWTLVDSTNAEAGSGEITELENLATDLPAQLADGTYELTVTAVDLVGNSSEPTTKSYTTDFSGPVLSFDRRTAQYTKGTGHFPESAADWIAVFGATATDSGAGMPDGGGISVDASDVDMNTVGSYKVVFTATDVLGNVSEPSEVTYEVQYVKDPSVTLTSSRIDWEMGTSPLATDALLEAFGVTATAAPGSAIDSLGADAADVMWDRLGDYSVTFTAVDREGNSATATGVLAVVDTIAPTLDADSTLVTWDGTSKQLASEAEWIDAFGAVASDSGSGVESVKVDASSVLYDRAGTYPVIFTATDVAGNVGTLTTQYTVAYAGAPAISLLPEITQEMGTTPITGVEAWREAFELAVTFGEGAAEKDVTVDDSAVDVSTEGTYDVTFVVTDTFGTKANATGRVVVTDTISPVISIKAPGRTHAASAPAQEWTASDFVDFFNATAKDGKGTGVDEHSWRVAGSVNWTTPGKYPLSLSVADQAKAPNRSKPVTVTVTIQGPPAAEDLNERIIENSTYEAAIDDYVSTTGSLKDVNDSDIALSAGGTAKVVDNILVYAPEEDFVGMETVTVTVTDDLNQSTTWTLNFDVRPKLSLKNEGEDTVKIQVPVDGEHTLRAETLLALVSGDAPKVSEALTGDGFQGKLDLDAEGNVTYIDSQTGWVGEQTAHITIADELGSKLELTLQIEVLPVGMVLDHTSDYVGGVFTAQVRNLVPNASYTLVLRSEPVTVASFMADDSGNATVEFVIPQGTPAGEHSLSVVNWNGADRATAKVEVNADGTVTVTPPALSKTGMSNGMVSISLAAAALLLGAGLLLLLARRRDRGRNLREALQD